METFTGSSVLCFMISEWERKANSETDADNDVSRWDATPGDY